MKYLIFNLKSNLTYPQIKLYAHQLSCLKRDLIIMPSNIYLNYFNNLGFQTCAQNVSKFDMGSYTGEVNALQLKSLGTNYVLIGHYERRNFFNENQEDLSNKIKQAVNNNLNIVYCIGEKEKNENVFDFLKEDIDLLINQSNKTNIIIAYEPFWAIGQNEILDISYINKILKEIREYIATNYNIKVPILYGGSIHANDVKILNNIESDGFLIGQSSTNIDEVFTLVNGLKQ